MSGRPRTLGVVVRKTVDGPEGFRAGVVWGVLPWLAGVGGGATPEEALSRLGARLRRLGYDPEFIVFDTLEAAQAEGRRRLVTEDVLRTLEDARVRLIEVLSGEGKEPDGRDREAMRSLDEMVRAVRAVAAGLYDREKQLDEGPPIRDGRLVCPQCGPDYPEAYFTATADALVTAYLSPGARLTDWKDPYVAEEAFRELQCGSCGRSFGDLTHDDLLTIEPEEEDE